MKKFITTLILIVTIILNSFALFSCTVDDVDHIHTFNMSYSIDKTHHWYSATCEHVNEVSGKGAHEYNNDFYCTVCGFKHEHEYSTEYAYDGNSHWNPSTCGHAEFKNNVINHVYNANYSCLFCGYEHQHNLGADGKCACGYDQNTPQLTVNDLVGKTFYLQAAVINDGEGEVLHDPSEVGYSKDFYNITFTSEGKGYSNIAMPIDKELTYEYVNGELLITVYRDTIVSENSSYLYKKEAMQYKGSFSDGRLVLNYKFNSNGVEKTRVYIFEPGEKLTDNFVDYGDFIGKTYSSKVEGQKQNYRVVTFKADNKADVTFYNYVNGEPVPDTYTDCVAILTSKSEYGTYYYVLKCKIKGVDYDIKFTLDGVSVNFKEVK